MNKGVCGEANEAEGNVEGGAGRREKREQWRRMDKEENK